MITGSCLCGAVQYRIDVPVNRLTHCHCAMCRKAHGAAFATFASVPKQAFQLVDGAEYVNGFRSSEHVTRTFCRRCGAALQFIDDREADAGVAAGTLDSALDATEQMHIYVASKADWYAIDDHLPRHAADS